MKRRSILFLTVATLIASSMAFAQTQGSDLSKFVGSFSAQCVNEEYTQTAFKIEIKLDGPQNQGLIVDSDGGTRLQHFEHINQDQQTKKFKGEESCYITETQSTMANNVIRRVEVITGCSIFSSRNETHQSVLQLEENGKIQYSKQMLDKKGKVLSIFACQLIRE